jgi:hypothetical protein
MRKVIVFLVFFLLTASNSAVVSSFVCDDFDNIEMPLDDKDVSEEDDDEVYLELRWLSKEKSSDSNLHIFYQESLFNDLELEVVVPPPKA